MLSRSALAPALPAENMAIGRRAFGWIALLVGVIFALYATTFWSMVEIWRRSETFAHGFLVVPIFLYLVWQRRAGFAQLSVRPFAPGLILLAALGFTWLLAWAAGALAPAQFALVALVPCAILTVFGSAWLRALLFPCTILLFAVPFGEVFVPKLIDWTANFTVIALRASGVPVYQEAAHFVVPTGRWSVVDACSGIRYLIASAMTGCLFASLMYRSVVRQVCFVAASIVVPIVANWVRAYSIVMLGHLSGNRIATGVDHLVYGWLFFGIVTLILFAVGRLWQESDKQTVGPAVTAESGASALGPVSPRLTMVAAGVAVLLPWPILFPLLTAPLGGSLPTRVAIEPNGGWRPASAFTQWKAVMQRPTLRPAPYVYGDDNGRVGVQIGIYRDQNESTKLVTSANRLVPEASAWHALKMVTGTAQGIDYRETVVKGDDVLLVRDWYWLGDHTTRSDVAAKVELGIDKLLGRDDTSAWVIIYTPMDENGDAARRLDAFMRDMQPSIESALRGLRP